MTHERMTHLYSNMLDYISEVVNKKEVENVLRKIGFTYEEIYDEGFETPLGKAKRLINYFCVCEYDGGANFDDLEHVGIAYTTSGDGEHDIQIEVDLVGYKMVSIIDGKVAQVVQFDSLEQMIEEELEVLDFENLIAMVDYI